MTPMLIAIPFWENDKSQAFDLCRIIAGLQTHHVGNEAHIMLVARQDCRHDINMVKIISAKFNTFTLVSASAQKGWPAGPNGMFASTMIHISTNNRNKYECVYWMEPDAIPLCANWFTDLLRAWRERPSNALIVGCRSDANGDGSGDHITGCALYDPEISRLMPNILRTNGGAWDYENRAVIVQRGHHTPLIENWYKATNADPGIVDRINVGVRIIHGFKDRSLVLHLAKKYGISLS